MSPAAKLPKPPALNPSQQAEFERAKRAARWVGLILPLALILAATVMLIVWLPRMPNPAATHWGFSGGPDGFGPPASYIWFNVCVGGGLVLMLWAFIAYSSRMPAPSPKRQVPVWSAYQRGLAAFAAGYAVFTATVNIGLAAVQLDLADAAEAPGTGWILGVAFGLWVLVGVAAWFAQPKVEILRGDGRASDPLPLGESERAVWFGRVRLSNGALWLVISTLLVVLAFTLLMFLVPVDPAERTGMLITRVVMVGVLLLVTALLGATAAFNVRIDERGLEARSVAGWPVFRLPAAEVKAVQTAQIAPFAEFGGWGLRRAPGRFGLVMRSGDGIIATRHDGRVFAITVDDAETAAAALSAAANRAGARAKATPGQHGARNAHDREDRS